MTDLSLALILADAIGGLQSALEPIAGIAAFLAAMGSVIAVGVQCDDGKGLPEAFASLRVARPFYAAIIIAAFLAAILPTRETLYMVAAAEVTEAAAVSDTGQRLIGKVEDALDALIDARR